MKETVIHKPTAGHMITNKEFCTDGLKACKKLKNILPFS